MIIEGQFRDYQIKYPEVCIAYSLYTSTRQNLSRHLCYVLKDREYSVSKISQTGPPLILDPTIKIISLLKL